MTERRSKRLKSEGERCTFHAFHFFFFKTPCLHINSCETSDVSEELFVEDVMFRKRFKKHFFHQLIQDKLTVPGVVHEKLLS
jgi:hypothetical protein